MVILNDIYKRPYNVLANPPIIVEEGPTPGSFMDIFEDIKKAFEEFQKTGNLQTTALQQAWNAYQGGTIDYLALLKSSLSLVGLLIPGGEAAVPFIGMFLDFVFPKLFGASGSNSDNVFEIIIKEVKQWTNQQFENFTLNSLNNTLIGIQSNISSFNEMIQIAICQEETPGDDKSSTPSPLCTPTAEHLKNVWTQFQIARTQIEASLPYFKNPMQLDASADFQSNYIMLTLPLYTMAATLNLTLYQSFIQFADKHKDVYYDLGTMEQTKANHRKNIKSYTATVRSTVINFQPTGDRSNKDKANLFNQYMRVMTVQCLDFVAIWPTLDPFDYPIQTELNPTRIILGDIVGPVEGVGDLQFSYIDADKNPLKNNDPLNYFYNGYQLSFASMNYENIKDNGGRGREHIFPKSLHTSYSNHDGTTLTFDSDNSSYNGSFSFPMPLTAINFASMYNSNEDVVAVYANPGGRMLEGNYYLSYTDKSGNQVIGNQKVQAIYPVTSYQNQVWGNGTKYGLIYTLIPATTSPTIIIKKDQITTFSAENTSSFKNSSTNNHKYELINGASAIQLNTKEEVTYKLTIQDPGRYQIRVRASTNTDSQTLSFQIKELGFTNSLTLPNTSKYNNDSQKGLSGEQTTYILIPESKHDGNFIYQTPTENIVNFNRSGTFTLTLQNTNSQPSPIVLDRIEFLSLPPTEFEIPILSGVENTIYEIWKNDIYYSKYLSGTIDLFQPWDTENSKINLTFEYFDGNTSLGTITQKYSGPDANKVHDIEKWTGKNFNRVTVKISDLDDSGTIYLENLIVNELTNQPSQFTAPEDLEKITNQVNQLFSSSSQTELAHTVSDYKIDQVVLKVNALSDDVFGVEKKALRKLVNQAKQLSKTRNVLVGGNFEKGHEWALGREATMVANHELFKGDHLLLPPPSLYPSYAYQKIDESKLKSNTRYTVSGFIAQSEHVEVIVSRYGKEVHDMLDVPYEEALPISSDESPNCCKPAACQCSSCDGSQPDSHFFSYNIDVGSVQSDVNLGIEFGLRIAKPNGFAKISNLEIKEDRPLTEKEIKKVQRKEQKWKKAFDQEQAELATTLQPTLDQINALYQNEDWNSSLHSHVTYQHLSAVVLPALPKQRHWFMEDREGEHYGVTQQFQQALDRAFQQIEEQNLIHNGSFANGLTDWTVTGDAQLTIFDEDPVLELAHWDASVSQTIEIMDFEEDTEYKLRVRGKGKGTVTVQHGEEELETMTFNTTSFTTQEQTF
ncbi:insecticidal delta-endotoxin Cry8Ea1 family protein, partial [Bacillus thuringiensis]